MKGVFVILDGVSDDKCYQLKNKTPLECAKIPNLDFFACNGTVDYCFPIAKGIAPQSSSGLVSLFGMDFRNYPRGILEALGAGVNLNDGDLAFRCNFATIDNLKDMNIIDRRAGRTLTTSEARELADSLNSKLKLPFKFELVPTIGHRAVLIFRGSFSANITNVDPSYEEGLSVENDDVKILWSKPNDESKKSVLTADLVNTFVKKSFVVLDNHEVNAKRKKKGFYPANFILCRDPGIAPLKYDKNLKGSWMGLGYMPLEIGAARALGMRVFSFNPDNMKSTDFYEHTEQVFTKAINSAVKMIDENKGMFDYFYVHFKETDLPGHDNKPLQKVKFIEMADKMFFSYLKKLSEKEDFRLVVTADHTTSCRLKRHTSSPVPVLFYDRSNLKNSGKRFTEPDSLHGKELTGRRLLGKTLFS